MQTPTQKLFPLLPFRGALLVSSAALLVSWGCTGSSNPTGTSSDGNSMGDGDGDQSGDGDGDLSGDGDSMGDGDQSGDGDGDGDLVGDGDQTGDGDGDQSGDGDASGGTGNFGGETGAGGSESSGGQEGTGGDEASGGQGTGGDEGSGGQGAGGGPISSCQDGHELCKEECTNVMSDESNCGGCEKVCESAPNSAPLCKEGTCAIECNIDFGDCDDSRKNGCETDLLSDIDHCGACGEPCKAACVDGSCVDSLVVFVTSQTFNGALGGLTGADEKCQKLAEEAELPGTFLAWLSDKDNTPTSRFAHSEVPYLLVDGTQVADNWNDLVDGSLDHAISLTEKGGSPPVGTTSCGGGGHATVWTGTSAAGSPYAPGQYTCNDWTSSGASGAAWGAANLSDGSWSAWCNTGGTVCNSLSALYCFQMPGL